MNPASWIILGGLIFAVVVALTYCFAARHRGGCSGSCMGCPYQGGCQKPNKKNNDK